MSMMEAAPGLPVDPAAPAPGAEQPQPAAGEAKSPEGQEPKADRVFSQAEVDEIARKVRKNESKRAERIATEREGRARAEAERDFLLRQQQGGERQPAKGRPLAKDFQSVEDFLDADYKWRRDQERQTETREQQERKPREEAQRSAVEHARTLQEKLSDGPDKYEDFEDKVFADDVPFTDPMVARIRESEAGVDLAYYLADHPKELRDIGKLSSTNQVIRLKEIEDKLTSPGKPTTVPAPITPSGARAPAEKDPEKMTDTEFRAWRKRQIAHRR